VLLKLQKTWCNRSENNRKYESINVRLYRDTTKNILIINYSKGPSSSWLYRSWIYYYQCNQCLSPHH